MIKKTRTLSILAGSVGVNTVTNTVSLGSSTSPMSFENGIIDSNAGIGSTGYVLTSIGAGVSWTSLGQSAQGIQGRQGLQGIQGRQGLQGIQGITGSGAQGIQGITGAQGPSGVGTGGSGAQGIQGIQGTFGTQGIQGPSGVGTGGSANQILYKNASNVVTGSSNLTFDGSNLTVSGVVIANNGFVSSGSSNAIMIDLIGNTLIFSVTGIGYTTLNLV